MFGGIALTGILIVAFVVVVIIAIIAMRFVATPTIDATGQIPTSVRTQATLNQHAFSPEQLSQIHSLVAQGQKIVAIKQVREWTGLGLAEAKSLVDALGDLNLSSNNHTQVTQSSYALTAEQMQQLLGLVAQGNKIEAIKHVREWLGFDLAAAKQFVDTLEKGAQVSQSTTTNNAVLSAEHILQIRDLIKQGNKIAAIKLVRDLTGLGLAEAKQLVDGLG
jgi:ribosomal protein L7/L12